MQGPQFALLTGVAGKALVRAVARDGIGDLLLVDAGRLTQPPLARVHAATVSGVPYHNAEGVIHPSSAFGVSS